MPSRIFVAQGACLMLLGLLAVALPHISTLAIEFLVGVLFFIGGGLRTASLLRDRTAPGFGWSLTAAILATVLGLVLLAGPSEGVLTLTMLLIVLFVVEGVAALVWAARLRRYGLPASWTLLSGVVDLVLAYLFWHGWPGTAAWAIGLLVGINMLFLGLALMMIGLAARAIERW